MEPFLPGEHGPRLKDLQYAPLAEITGRSPSIAPAAVNCAAPNTMSRDLLRRYTKIGGHLGTKTFAPPAYPPAASLPAFGPGLGVLVDQQRIAAFADVTSSQRHHLSARA